MLLFHVTSICTCVQPECPKPLLLAVSVGPNFNYVNLVKTMKVLIKAM